MLTSSSYRTCDDYREILRILQKTSSLQDNFLWQPQTTGKNIVPVQHFEIDFVSRGVVITFEADKFYVQSAQPIYIKLEYRETVFKVSDYKINGHTISFALPKELKTLELRENHRTQVHQKYVSLKPTLHPASVDLKNEIQMKVVDISESGVGLLVTEHSRAFLKNNRILWLTRLDDKRIEYPVLSEVVYISAESEGRAQRGKQRELKVGLKLSGAIPPNMFQDFIQ